MSLLSVTNVQLGLLHLVPFQQLPGPRVPGSYQIVVTSISEDASFWELIKQLLFVIPEQNFEQMEV